jgi:hypothetical protein
MLAAIRTLPSTRSRFRGAIVSALALLAADGLSSQARAQTYHFFAAYNGAQEAPPTASTASAQGYFVLDTNALTLSYSIVYSGLQGTISAVHVHGFAAPGVNAGVLAAPPTGASPITGSVAAQASWVPSFLAGLAYSNIHSTAFPAGEIRGQLLRLPPQISLAASYTGAQEVPPNASTATASGAFVLHLDTLSLDYNISYSGLQGSITAVHVHGFAPPGVNAGVLFAPPIGLSPIIGSSAVQAVWVPQILNGQSYSNIHSTAFPGGEIRGQILWPTPPGMAFCEPGQGGLMACPCGNVASGPFRGCNNSLSTGGASISGTGVASIAADTLVLSASGIGSLGSSCANANGNLTSLLLQGTAVTPGGLIFNDGVRCLSGSLKRIQIASSVAGVYTSSVSISARSSVLGDPLSSGLTRYYGVWYRDSCATHCPTAASNISNGYVVTWGP